MLRYLVAVIFIIIVLVTTKYIFATINSHSASLPITLKSSAFRNEAIIPEIYTGISKDISPPLEWKNIPKKTKSIAIICNNPDTPCGDWTHWIVFDIDPKITKLQPSIPVQKIILGRAKQGRNDFGALGYGGPMPPPGNLHRYYFKIYALDKMLNASPGIKKNEFLALIKGHVLAEGSFMGKFKR